MQRNTVLPAQKINSEQKNNGSSDQLSTHCKKAAEALISCNFLEKIKIRRSNYKETNKIELTGIATQYSQIDDVTDGFQQQQLIILAARTGMGKSWVALNWLKKIAIDQNIPTAFFSLEMSNSQVFYRLVSLQSGVPIKIIKNGTLNDKQFEKVKEAVEEIKNAQLYLTDDPENSDLAILNQNIEKSCIDDKAEIVFIDHINLVTNPTGAKEQRSSEMGTITRALKIAAKNLKIPIICLAQLNRDADKDEHPKLSNLRDSGSLEQDPDLIIFIHRSDYYRKENKPGEIDIIIAKNRNGEQGSTINFTYNNSWKISEKNNKYQQQTSNENTQKGGRSKITSNRNSIDSPNTTKNRNIKTGESVYTIMALRG